MKKLSMWMLAGVLALGLAACAKKADTNKPVEEIKAEVQTMSLKDVESNAKAYAHEISAKQSEVEKVSQQVKSLSATEIFSEKAKGLKEQISKIGNEVSALTERYQIYAQKYQELGGDIANIKAS